MCAGLRVFAQIDTISGDTLPPLPPLSFHFQSIGISWVDGNIQFFEGYDHEILYANAESGLPIYPDWPAYSRGVIQPKFFQFGANIGLVDTIRGIKLRFSAFYAQRSDSFAYGSDFAINDTIFGRHASEKGSFGSIGFAGMKQSRKLLGFVRFHGGAEFEIGLSPSSRISYSEYAYDLGENRLIEYNTFNATGKPRFNLFCSAILGLETVFWHHIGFTAEVKSGLGAQLVVKERGFGMARTSYHVGLNYYLFDYKRKALPRPVLIPYEEDETPPPPTPDF